MRRDRGGDEILLGVRELQHEADAPFNRREVKADWLAQPMGLMDGGEGAELLPVKGAAIGLLGVGVEIGDGEDAHVMRSPGMVRPSPLPSPRVRGEGVEAVGFRPARIGTSRRPTHGIANRHDRTDAHPISFE